MSRMVSFFVLLGVILLLGAVFFRVMATFFVPLFLAALFVVIFRPVHRQILDRCKGRVSLAAGLTTTAILLIVLVPAVGVFTMAVIEGSSMITRLDVVTVKNRLAKLRSSLDLETPYAAHIRTIESALRQLYEAESFVAQRDRDFDRLVDHLSRRVQSLQSQLEQNGSEVSAQALLAEVQKLPGLTPGTIDFEATVQVAMREFRELKLHLFGGALHAWLIDLANPSDERIREWSGKAFSVAQDWLLSIGGATTAFAGRLVLGLVIMVISIFFFLLDGPRMLQAFMRLSPLDDRYEQELMREFDEISRAVVIATLLSAVVQGLLAGFGYWLAGLDSVFLLMLLTMVMAMVPFVGAAAVWVPVTLWLYFYEERTLAAIVMAIYGTLVISMADNVIKPLVLHGRSKLHPLLALLSVLGGVQVLGPIGILVGPMVVVFLQTLLNILHRELSSMDKSSNVQAGKDEGSVSRPPT